MWCTNQNARESSTGTNESYCNSSPLLRLTCRVEAIALSSHGLQRQLMPQTQGIGILGKNSRVDLCRSFLKLLVLHVHHGFELPRLYICLHLPLASCSSAWVEQQHHRLLDGTKG